MLAIQKKGQFFLIASFVIIVIIFSFSTIYNSTNSPVSNYDKTTSIAKAIKYESSKIIDNGLYNALSEQKINQNILNITYFYSKSNLDYNFTVIYGNTQLSAMQYYDGSATDVSSSLSIPEINLTLNNMEYNFYKEKGYNFYVIVQKEGENERYIARA